MSNSFIRKSKRLLTLTLTLTLTLPSLAQKQDKKDLENKKRKLLEEIANTNEILSETKKEKKRSLTELAMINKKISAREELIATINYEIIELNRRIRDNNTSIKQKQDELARLKADYARMIYHAYKNQDAYSRLMFVFASHDFEQAYMRLKYLQQYSEFRHKQAAMIESTKKVLNGKIQQLEEKKSDKKALLSNEEAEKLNLSNEKTEREEVFGQLQEKEKQLKSDLEKKKKDAERLQQAIARIIEEELRKAREKQKEDGKPVTKTLALTREAEALSSTFANNQGKLPWPVVKGVITGNFGVHPHPLYKDIEVTNNGIDISTSKSSLARAVFDGEVTGVASIPNSGKVIIVRHGEYLSVYANLSEVHVKTGDKVKTKQNIGTVMYDESDGKTELHLEIWKGQTRLDPEGWLFRSE